MLNTSSGAVVRPAHREAGARAPESVAATLARLGSYEHGLSSAEAAARLEQYGPNEPAAVRYGGPLTEFLHFCSNPLVLILLTASAISAALGQLLDAAIIAAMVVLSVVLNFFQAYRSEQAVKKLRDQVAPTATVLRDAERREIARHEVVPGDVVELSAGDLVPADARLIRSRDLHMHEAALTGESMPAEKDAAGPACTVFLGTSVVSGSALAVVTATGAATAFGDLASRLATQRPETEFDRGTRRFGLLIMRTIFFLVLFILAVNIGLGRDALESLLFAVALAVGLTPEFLPMITTVTLATGAVRMAREKVIVKHLTAIQNFGSIDVLCSDKTGTLTAATMRMREAVDPFGRPCERAATLAYLNSRFETGIRSALDSALLEALDRDVSGWRKTDEIPFDFERRRLSVVLDDGSGPTMITKGAPESVLSVSARYELDGAQHALDDSARTRCIETFEALSRGGFRVLAVAYRSVAMSEGLSARDETGLTLAGFVSFIDPPLEDAAESLRALSEDGVRVKILTGDNEMVTRYVCERVGISTGRIVLGDEMDAMGDAALAHVAEQVDVFARVSPAQKNRIILALRGRSHVVGYLGDGINDAPSMHAAEVGITVPGAVDVAREAADIILLERNLRVLHSGILEGRKAFANVFKYLLMGTSSNFGNMFSMAGAVLFLPFLPMLPTQILLNNFLYDLAQVTIPTDNVDPAWVRGPRRWDVGAIRNFMLAIGPLSSIYDFLTFAFLLWAFGASQTMFHTGWFVESLATQTLVLFVIRTAARPWKVPPSRPLAITTLAVVAAAIALIFTPLGAKLGFDPMPPVFFVFLVVAVGTYLALVEIVKNRFSSRLMGSAPAARPL